MTDPGAAVLYNYCKNCFCGESLQGLCFLAKNEPPGCVGLPKK